MPDQRTIPGRAFPWVAVSCCVFAGILALWPWARDHALYDRAAIAQGQVWRLFTGHFVHFGLSHLGWNVAVTLAAGIWLECRWPALARTFMLLAPVAISLVLLAGEPGLEVYGGLSGVATGMCALLGLGLIGMTADDRWWGGAMLALVGLKTTGEWVADAPLFARFADETVRVVPLAHLGGVAVAVLFFAVHAKRSAGWKR